MNTLRFVELSLLQLAAEVPLSGCVLLGVLCSIVLIASARGGIDG
jgi:hypothetical protein